MSVPPHPSEPSPRKKDPEQRSVGAWVKLWVGGVGSGLCVLWWSLLLIMLFLPDPADGASELLLFNSHLTILTVSLLLTVLFLVVLRSGLRGPADPLAPDESKAFERREESPLPLAPGGSPDTQPKAPTRKKRHLRLV